MKSYVVLSDRLKLLNVKTLAASGSGLYHFPAEHLHNCHRNDKVDALSYSLHLALRFFNSLVYHSLHELVQVSFCDLQLTTTWD